MKRCYSVRFDDVCPTMERDKFNAICEILEQKGAYPLLGVVPKNVDHKLIKVEEDANFWEEMKILQQKGYAIAQHGTYHEYCTKHGGILNINKKSEFAGLSYEDQYEKLKKGKEILTSHGIETDIFMAPAHSYDKNTIKAAKALGFKYFTDGYTNYPYKIKGVIFIPCRTILFDEKHKFDTCCIHANTLSDSFFNRFMKDFNTKELMSFNKMIECSKEKLKIRNVFIEKMRIFKIYLSRMKNRTKN